MQSRIITNDSLQINHQLLVEVLFFTYEFYLLTHYIQCMIPYLIIINWLALNIGFPWLYPESFSSLAFSPWVITGCSHGLKFSFPTKYQNYPPPTNQITQVKTLVGITEFTLSLVLDIYLIAKSCWICLFLHCTYFLIPLL